MFSMKTHQAQVDAGRVAKCVWGGGSGNDRR